MTDNLKCPKCAGPMVSRLNSRTKQQFWGCGDFPQCKGTRDSSGMSYNERRNYIGCDDYEDSDMWHPGHPSNYGDQ